MLATPPCVFSSPVQGHTPAMSVTDTDEIQAPRRRGCPGLGAVAPFEQRPQPLRGWLNHRPDRGGVQVGQKAFAVDPDPEASAAAMPARPSAGWNEAPWFGLP